MRWIHNLPSKYKSMAIAGAGLIGFVLYLGYTYVTTEQTSQQINAMRTSAFTALREVNAVSVDLATLKEDFDRAIDHRSERKLLAAQQHSDDVRLRLQELADLTPRYSSEHRDVQSAFNNYSRLSNLVGVQAASRELDPATVTARQQELNQMATDVRQRFDRLRTTLERNLGAELQSVQQRTEQTWQIGLAFAGILIIIVLVSAALLTGHFLILPLNQAVQAADRIANGDWDIDIQPKGRDEVGRLLYALNKMRLSLRGRFDEDRRNERIKTVVADLGLRLRGEQPLGQLIENILNFLVPAVGGRVGLFYLHREGALHLSGSYAFTRRKSVANHYQLGESLVGQAALEKKTIVLAQVPEDYVAVASGLGETTARAVIVAPVLHEGELLGVLEVGTLADVSAEAEAIISQCLEIIAVALHSATSRVQLREMLQRTQEQARKMEQQQADLQAINLDLEEQAIAISASEMKLQQQQDELKKANEELEEQAQQLRASEESLQAQQEELRVINEELEEQAKLLAEQRNELLDKNEQLKRAQEIMEEKNRQLEMSSKYKSEFLSTMSHELRTPLNSILILSNSLSDNKPGNLNAKQVEHAQVIHSAGADLLSLINDILDIAKVEEGKMQLMIEPLPMTELRDHLMRNFEHVAQHRGLSFKVELDEHVPAQMHTDRQRLEQVLRNFFSNAFKFTHQGGVTLRIGPAPADVHFRRIAAAPEQVIAFRCTDTGIGVPKDKQDLIFEAFQQADGTTSRKYGGTGLGLTISRELTHLLGGEVHLQSEGEGKGSTFILYLPIGEPEKTSEAAEPAPTPMAKPAALPAPRREERLLLVIDDDPTFAGALAELAEDFHFRALVAHEGALGLEMAQEFRPDAIILDIGLPDMDGWGVMNALKADERTQEIPVHFISGHDERERALSLGAIDYLQKPVTSNKLREVFGRMEGALQRSMRRLLVVEDCSRQHQAIHELFRDQDVEVHVCSTGEEALSEIRTGRYDCMILDLSLPDMDGFDLLELLHDLPDLPALPIIVYTGRDLSREEEATLRRHADRIILKTERSPERLLSEASLFLHWLDSNRSQRQKPADQASHRDEVFTGCKVLLVDDDMRNIYALSSSLEEWGCDITVANNGREALNALNGSNIFDIVLMDIMMPEMDGYEAMRHIRAQERFAKMPILALTAKAMKEDRSRCLEAGASDYIAKPIDIDKLQSLMRVWLHGA